MLYALAGAVASSVIGVYLVAVIAAAGLLEVRARSVARSSPDVPHPGWFAALPGAVATGGLGALVWVALKVGMLSYGGGFVIVPLMQHDAVEVHQWMTAGQFLNAVALGQVTPGPVVLTIAAVGYAAGGLAAGVLAAVVAFAPSFVFVMTGGPHFDRLRRSHAVQSFLTGAGAAALGGIAGAAVPLAGSLSEPWQLALLAAAGVWLLVLRRGVVSCLVAAGVTGALATALIPSLPLG
jgi:chromate transporter